ncbi:MULTISPECIES: hypothetical protein [Exiguobacterium]|uniref:hypothetical protein n=1 Tax=Exiguobacterium TaxID=33986 RepID=UPI001AE64B3D|nr:MULTISPECIES: hypothetical protein [Exiguobacterium]MCT4779817.1 hypothetical protein [Exiguobacterium soli]
MNAEQIIEEILDTAETLQEEENVLADQPLSAPVRDSTWTMGWGTGRFGGRATGEQAIVERVVKYMLTPRGEFEVYPGNGTVDYESDEYGSLIYELVGEVYASNEDITQALQGICDQALVELTDVQMLTVVDAKVVNDKVTARIIVTVENGEETEVELNGIGI